MESISFFGTKKAKKNRKLVQMSGYDSCEVKSSPETPGHPMIAKKSIGPLLGVCYAAVFGTLMMVGLHSYWPDMNIWVLVLLSAAFFVAFYFAGLWVHVSNEQNKKLPTNSKELRRRTKGLYDWLHSQGGPQARR